VEPNVLRFVQVVQGRNHIGLAIRAFLRLELHWLATGISWYEAKLALVRHAIRAYLAAPRFVLPPTA
jgi:putative transposase